MSSSAMLEAARDEPRAGGAPRKILRRGKKCLAERVGRARRRRWLSELILTTFCYHSDGDGSDGEDCRGGMRLSHFRANSVAISLILTPAAVAVWSAALWTARAASRLRTLSNASIGVLGLTMRSFLRL